MVAGLLAAVLAVGLLAGCSGGGADNRVPTRSEITALLDAHAAALRGRDESAFLAGTAGQLRTRQRAAFANLADVPLSTWSYRLGPRVDDEDAQRAARKAHGASAEIVRLTLRYGLRGIDSVPSEHDLWWTFARRDGRVVAVTDTDLADEGGESWRGPWDFGPLRVASGTSSLVLAHPDDADLLPGLVAAVDRAVPVVTGVVGSAWTRRVAVIVPASADELRLDLGPAAAATAEIGAVAVSDGTDPVTGAVRGQRVVVVPDQFRTLTAAGTRLVLQHEITHVATAARTTSSTPTWLVEGFADYVGHLGDGRAARAAAPDLAALVDRDGVPAALPDAASFISEQTSAAAYELSWLACRRIAAQHGQPALVRFYDAVGAADVPGDEAVTTAARTVLGETPAQFAARTRAYVGGQLR